MSGIFCGRFRRLLPERKDDIREGCCQRRAKNDDVREKDDNVREKDDVREKDAIREGQRCLRRAKRERRVVT
jgi:hypothetical protein